MESIKFDLSTKPLREVNQFLHGDACAIAYKEVTISNPNGAHNIAVGLKANVDVTIDGHAGYYAGGMNQLATITITGSAGTGVAENMMSGKVHVKGFASNAAGATSQGGLLVIDGDAGLRCGISLKGADIVVGGSVGSFSAFMAQAGNLVILGDAGRSPWRLDLRSAYFCAWQSKKFGCRLRRKTHGRCIAQHLNAIISRRWLCANQC